MVLATSAPSFKIIIYAIAGIAALTYYLTSSIIAAIYVGGIPVYWVFLYMVNSVFSTRSYSYRPRKAKRKIGFKKKKAN